MSTDNPYSTIITEMRRQGARNNGYDMAKAVVLSIDPLAIDYNGVQIADHLVYNQLLTSDLDDQLQQVFAHQDMHVTTAFKDLCAGIYKQLRLQPGDAVLVQRVGNYFYVLGKVG